MDRSPHTSLSLSENAICVLISIALALDAPAPRAGAEIRLCDKSSTSLPRLWLVGPRADGRLGTSTVFHCQCLRPLGPHLADAVGHGALRTSTIPEQGDIATPRRASFFRTYVARWKCLLQRRQPQKSLALCMTARPSGPATVTRVQ
ncbi:hypothetical protein K466DRAFT_397619 [Polyporus arcularius HHB13444]|uniref:Uncharacterized protein n=1 Tax=Polyporus arcularius HHB13444 TaxID=1314778 RepID=A0A5C3Q232_9APHY|nr:hypothetical protein K466DRAFT_397619 [Polyporus arcularius HHB13444]